MAQRYFTADIQGENARITGADAAHLIRVLRVKPGDTLCLCDGKNTDYTAQVLAADHLEVWLRVVSSAPSGREPSLWAEVFLGYARGERMEWAIQKSVELGASRIQPFFSERCMVKPGKDENKTRRFARIAEEAAKQCGRGILPAVDPPLPFAEMLQRAARNEQVFFFYEEGGAPLRSLLQNPASAGLITGPEGGFSPAEAQLAMDAGFRAVGLGPRILRSETAPAAALAALMTLTGNLE